MRPPDERDYDIRLKRASQPSKDCPYFHEFVKRKAQSGRKMLHFEILKEGTNCEVEVRFRCESCGKRSFNRFRRDVVLKFPNVVFVRFVRQR